MEDISEIQEPSGSSRSTLRKVAALSSAMLTINIVFKVERERPTISLICTNRDDYTSWVDGMRSLIATTDFMPGPETQYQIGITKSTSPPAIIKCEIFNSEFTE